MINKGLLMASSQIFTILTDISSRQCALLIPGDLITFSMSLSEKLIDVNLVSVSKSREPGKELLLLKGAHLEGKNL